MEAIAIAIFDKIITEGILEVSAVVLIGMVYAIYLLRANTSKLAGITETTISVERKIEKQLEAANAIDERIDGIKGETIRTNAMLSILSLQSNRSIK